MVVAAPHQATCELCVLTSFRPQNYSRVYTQILTRSDPGQASTLGAIAELKNNPGYI